MKRSTLFRLSPTAIVAVGVFLGRGAQAETILTFDALPAGQPQNQQIIQTFGDNAAASSEGVSVVGTGTPNIGLTWSGSGEISGTRWDFYIDAVWSAGQLDGSGLGAAHNILFTPTAGWAVRLSSFNFHPYYVSAETFDYTWSVLDGANVLASGSTSFGSDATKNHPVTIDYMGNPDQALTLSILRTGGSGGTQNIAIDDLTFAQVPEPSTAALFALTGLAGLGWAARRRCRRKGGP
jgi:hypothetical protein